MYNDEDEDPLLGAAGSCCLLTAIEHLPLFQQSPKGLLSPLSCPEEVLQLEGNIKPPPPVPIDIA